MGEVYDEVVRHVRLSSAVGSVPAQAEVENNPNILTDLLQQMAAEKGVSVYQISRRFMHSNFESVDWWKLNLAGMCFKGCGLHGGDMSQVSNIDQAQFDFRTATEKADVNYDKETGWIIHWCDQLILPPGVSHVELKFRDFDPERDLITTCGPYPGGIVKAQSEIDEINFYDLDVSGMDFSWLTRFHSCDFSRVKNIDQAIFTDLGEYNWTADENNMFPEGVVYSDLKLVPPKRPREWVRK